MAICTMEEAGMNQNGIAMRFKISQSQVSHSTSGHLRDEVGPLLGFIDVISPFIIQCSFRVTESFSRKYMLQVVRRKHLVSTVCLSDKILWQSQSHHCCALCNVNNHSNALAFVTRDWITSKKCDSISCRKWFDVTNYVTSVGCRAALCSSQFSNLRRNNWTQLNFICKSHNI